MCSNAEHGRRLTYLKREGLVLLELDEQDGLLVVRGHELALRIPVGMPSIAQPTPGDESWMERRSQSTAVEAGHKVRYALPFDTEVWREDIVADSESDWEDEQPRGVQ